MTPKEIFVALMSSPFFILRELRAAAEVGANFLQSVRSTAGDLAHEWKSFRSELWDEAAQLWPEVFGDKAWTRFKGAGSRDERK